MQHAVITGASSGIGLALAQKYLQNGFKVSVCSRNVEALKAQFPLQTEFLFCQQADVSIEKDCQTFIQMAILQNGPINILINNAGISMRALFADAQLSVIEKVMNINFWGAVYCSKFALPSILETKGNICSISSIAGHRGLPARSGYSASKFALHGFMESLRTELLHTGVNIMWVCPGFTASNIRNAAINEVGNSQAESPINEKLLMTANQCAEHIMAAIQKRKRTLTLTTQGKFTVWLNKWWPSLADQLVYNHFAKEPNSPIK